MYIVNLNHNFIMVAIEKPLQNAGRCQSKTGENFP